MINISDGNGVLGLHVVRSSVHLADVIWYELDTTLVESKRVSEMTGM